MRKLNAYQTIAVSMLQGLDKNHNHQCTVCKKIFKTGYVLTNHIINSHPTEIDWKIVDAMEYVIQEEIK